MAIILNAGNSSSGPMTNANEIKG
ncbi:hypothetical protein CNEO2_300024 [Clostridium neonatale]|nr:hypothetical protein CNEO2_300024 [Clostridium neonatale]